MNCIRLRWLILLRGQKRRLQLLRLWKRILWHIRLIRQRKGCRGWLILR